MNNTQDMRSLTADEIDAVAGAGSLNIIIAPQINAGISAAISVFGNANSLLVQKNLGISAIQSKLKL